MGSKLSIFKKPVNENEHKHLSTDKKKEDSTQPSSDLKDQSNKPLESAVNGIVESLAEDLSKIELKEQSESVTNDRDITQDSKQETEEPSKCLCNPCECNPCNCVSRDCKEVDKIESQVSDDKAIVEDSKQELVPSNDKSLEEPKEPAKCLCNPCECNPCNCVPHDHKENTESTKESAVIENNDKVTEEEPKHESVQQSESIPSEDNDSTPQESNQELANPSDVS
jgi:hypothetical protein